MHRKKKIQTHKHSGKHMSNVIKDFPGCTVDMSTPTNAGDTCAVRSVCTAAKSIPQSPQLENAQATKSQHSPQNVTKQWPL